MIGIKIIHSSQKIHLSQTWLFNHFDFIMIETAPKNSSSKPKPTFFHDIIFTKRLKGSGDDTENITLIKLREPLCAPFLLVKKCFNKNYSAINYSVRKKITNLF